ncbi:MAG: glycosyltransferase [bacterium]
MTSFRRLDRQIFDKNWDTLSFYHPHTVASIRRAIGFVEEDACPDLPTLPMLDGIQDVLIEPGRRMMAVSQSGSQSEIIGPEWNGSPRAELTRVLSEINPRVLFLFSCGDLSCLDDCRTLGGFDRRIVLVLESWMILFLAALAIRDLTDFLSHPNVFFCIGPDYGAEALDIVHEQALFAIAPAEVAGTAGAGFVAPEDRDAYISSIRGLLQELAEEHRNFVTRYENFVTSLGRDQRLDKSRPVRIWGYAVAPEKMVYSIHLEMLQSLFNGFQAVGQNPRLFIESRERWTTRLRILDDITSFEPDIYFFLNNVPDLSFQALFGFSWKREMVRRPRFVWLVDEFAFSPICSTEGLGPLDHVFAMDPAYVDRLRDRDLGALHYLPVAASIQTPGKMRDCYRHPISFVGSVVDLSGCFKTLGSDKRSWMEERISRIESGETLFDVLPDDFLEIPAALVKAAEDYSDRVRKPFLRGIRAVRYLISVEANVRKRVRAVRSLLPYGLAVYGPPEWKNLLPENGQNAYHGPLPFDQLPDLFASSSINLNLHSLQCPRSLNPRDFDVLAAGGFLLSDRVPEADAGLLADGEDAVFYQGETDLSEKVHYYLENEDERNRIAERGHETVMERHLLLHRAEKMLSLFYQTVNGDN